MPLTLVENPGRHRLEGVLLLVDCLIGLFVLVDPCFFGLVLVMSVLEMEELYWLVVACS